MRFNYLVYPEAKKRLQTLELEERFKEAEKSEEGLPYFGTHVMEEEVVDCVNDLKERGYFKTLLEEERQQFITQLNQIFQNLDKYSWRINRMGKTLEEKTDLHDLLLMTGWISSLLLKPEEIWDYKKYGFDSLSGFTGSVGALVWNLQCGGGFREGYKWKSKSPDERGWINEITGDTHGDLRICKTDITPDETFDPLGNKVLYRPELNDDKRIVAGYHSVESEFLVSLLKYVHQQNINSKSLRDNANPLIEKMVSFGHVDSDSPFPDYFTSNIDFLFNHFEVPIPVLDENYSTEERTLDAIGIQGGGYYGIYVGPNKEIIFSYENRDEKTEIKKPSVIFYPQEIDHLITGVCFQCAKRLGRTSSASLVNLLKYRFSDEFEKYQKFLKVKS